jgi:hypothetical protein
MQKHTKLYLDYFGYTKEDFIACEICGKKAVDIHHIDCRGMGGSKQRDTIENLMAVCRPCHMKYGDIKEYTDYLKETHLNFINNYGKIY